MNVRTELLSATDEIIEGAVQYADRMVLRGLLYQFTGDEALAEMEISTRLVGLAAIISITKELDIALIRAKAAGFLKNYRDQGAGEFELGAPDRLYRSLGLTAGAELPEGENEIWLEQSAIDPWARGISWKEPPTPEQRTKFTVGVIGSGLSGLNAAVHLKRVGIPFIVLEKNPEVGGTWYENRYPGARVDTLSRSYTHLFGTGFSYPYSFCPQQENLRYMKWVADNFGIRDDISFNTEVKSVLWDDAENVWNVTADSPSGPRSLRFNAIISCVGFLSRPQLPHIAGMEDFKGQSFHTAQWPESLDITGKRVAVIGSGASGYQTTPEIAKKAAHTFLFQRTPSWCFEHPDYVRPLPEQVTWVERNLPYYVNFNRFRLSWLSRPSQSRLALRVDPDFDDPHARSAYNKQARDGRVAYIRAKFASRPDLAEKMIPVAPPISSRPIIIDTNDSIYDALLRDNVTLVTDRIEEITANGIRTGEQEYPLDIIVYATGFKTNDYLWPMEIRGRNGVKIEDLWAKDGPRAYVGSMLPGFPNFFMSYGPNSNNFGGLGVVDLLEIVMRFALQCIAGLITQQKASVEVKADAYWQFNGELDREERFMLYMDPRASNYYRNGAGRSSVNCPVDFHRMWRWLRDPTGAIPDAVDGGVRPHFGGDLIVS